MWKKFWKVSTFIGNLLHCACSPFTLHVIFLSPAIKGEVIGSGNAILDVHSFLLIALCQFVELQLHDCSTREVISALYRLEIIKLIIDICNIFVSW